MTIRTSDHNPPHVHVFKAGHEIKVAIGDESTQPTVLGRWDTPERYVAGAVRLIERNKSKLLECWRGIHG